MQIDPYIIGSIIENFVVLEICKQLSWNSKRINMFHYRDYANDKIDIILEVAGGDIVALEIKSQETVSGSDFKALRRLQESLGNCLVNGIVLYTGATSLPFGDRLSALPIASLWS